MRPRQLLHCAHATASYDISLVIRAIEFAARKHRMQRRKDSDASLIVATVASAILGSLLTAAVLQMYPDIDPGELFGRVNLVLALLTVLGMVWYFRRK